MSDVTEAPKVAEEDVARLVTELRQKLEAVTAENAQLQKEVDHFSPYRNWPLFTTPDEVRAFLGDDLLKAMAQTTLGAENRKRTKQGLPGLHLSDPDEYRRLAEQVIEQTLIETVEQQTSWVGERLDQIIPQRMIKMVNPNGTMVQIPLEITINNAAGSLNDPMEVYKRKGHKLAWPVRCLLRDCWAVAALDSREKPIYDGYCSEFHRQIIDGAKDREGVMSGRRTRRRGTPGEVY